MKTLIVYILTCLIPTTLMAQTAYDRKLESLYSNTVETIKPEVLKQVMEQDKKPIILDTRSKEEYRVSHIPGAMFVDYDTFDADKWKHTNKDQLVVVYCTVGYRSERIGEKLNELGFKNVRNLYGGIFQWVNEGNRVVDSNDQPTQQVHTYSQSWSKWLKKGEKVYE